MRSNCRPTRAANRSDWTNEAFPIPLKPPFSRASAAASVQLSVPVITAVGGLLLLNETPSVLLVLSSLAILGGIALVIDGPKAT